MNYEGTLTPWHPLLGLKGYCYIYSVHNDEKGFKVILVEEDNNERKIIIAFPNGVRSYRATDELLSINALEVAGEVNESISPDSWSLFKITDSEYLRWASERSSSISEDLNLIHFAICTIDWTLEILDNAEPIVEFIDVE